MFDIRWFYHCFEVAIGLHVLKMNGFKFGEVVKTEMTNVRDKGKTYSDDFIN